MANDRLENPTERIELVSPSPSRRVNSANKSSDSGLSVASPFSRADRFRRNLVAVRDHLLLLGDWGDLVGLVCEIQVA